MGPHGGSETWRHTFLQYVQESFLYQHVTELTRIRSRDTPSILNLTVVYTVRGIEDIGCGTIPGKYVLRMLELEYMAKEVLTKEIEESRCQEEILRKELCGYFFF